MLIDRSHRTWGISILAATIVSSLIYVYTFHPAWLSLSSQPNIIQPRMTPGHTVLGLIYGSIALAIFLFSCLLGWRRKRPALRIGRVQSWLRAHIWLSIFTIPLVLMHAGFTMGGPMTTLLMVLYAIVIVSGFFGLGLQQILPRIMAEEFPTEAIYEQIPYIRSQLVLRAQAICDTVVKPPAPAAVPVAAGTSDNPATAPPSPTRLFPAKAVQDISDVILPYLKAKNGKRLPLGNKQVSFVFFRRMRIEVPNELEPTVAELQDLCDERRQLDLQSTYQHWLHGWLIVHVPLSLALLLLTVWHAIVARYFD